MLSLSQTTGYAVLALGCIGSRKGSWVLSQHIQKCTGISMPYLRKVLHALGKSGLIKAKRGYQGGYVLARPASQITLLDIVKIVESDKPGSGCALRLPGCSDATPCPLRGFWQKELTITEEVVSELRVASDDDRNLFFIDAEGTVYVLNEIGTIQGYEPPTNGRMT